MRMAEIRAMTDAELGQRLADLREESFNLRFQFATRQLTNHARIHEVRHDIARILTDLQQRQYTALGEEE